MIQKIVLSIFLLGAAVLTQLHAQDFSKLAFNIGGGMSTPLNPTGNYAGLGGNFAVGAGYNIDKKNTVFGEFQWNGLPPNTDFNIPNPPFGSVNLYSLTANYRRHMDRLGGSPFGVYAIAGGGWYYRFASVDRTFFVTPGTPCLPLFFWWGFGCEAQAVTETVASRGNSAGGVNAGGGFTIRLSDSGWKFYVESRYNYAWSNRIATTFVPVTFGFRFN